MFNLKMLVIVCKFAVYIFVRQLEIHLQIRREDLIPLYFNSITMYYASYTISKTINQFG